MLKARIGLARKFSRNYNSTGYSVELEGEVFASPDQPDAILTQIQRLFQLGEKALQETIDRAAVADTLHCLETDAAAGKDNTAGRAETGVSANANGKAPLNRCYEPATSRQLQYIQNLGKRHGWSAAQLEDRIGAMLGEARTIQELAKKEAGRVIDELARHTTVNGSR